MNQMTWQSALNGIRNGESDYRIARGIFNDDGTAGNAMTVAAARLADDMADCFGAFGTIAESGDFKGARVLASFGAMAAELRRLQDSEAELKRLNGAMQRELNDCTRRGAELESSLSAHATRAAERDSLLASYREAAGRFTFGQLRDAESSDPFRLLWNAYAADCDAEREAERGE